jgi:hypothetical protein
MRFLALLAVSAAALVQSASADAQRGENARPVHQRDQDAAFHGRQTGDILPLPVILQRVRVRGAQFIGADLDSSGTVYRLTYMQGPNVIRVLVNARTGQPLSISR